MGLVIDFFVAMIATISFSILFNAPRRELPFCGITGAIGWLVYCLSMDVGDFSAPIASLFATAVLSLVARGFAVYRQMPVTVYLLAGIFPLVPGAGIYYTAYYLFIGENTLSGDYAIHTFLVAGSMVLGIIFSFALPQKFFHNLCRKPTK